MVSTPEICTNNSPMKHNPSISTKESSARKSLIQLLESLDDKNKTSGCRFGADQAKRRTIKKSMCCCQTLQSSVVIQK